MLYEYHGKTNATVSFEVSHTGHVTFEVNGRIATLSTTVARRLAEDLLKELDW